MYAAPRAGATLEKPGRSTYGRLTARSSGGGLWAGRLGGGKEQAAPVIGPHKTPQVIDLLGNAGPFSAEASLGEHAPFRHGAPGGYRRSRRAG